MREAIPACITAIGYTAIFSVLLSQPVLAQLISESGNLRITWLRSHEQSCATGEPHGQYEVSGGVNGLLYPTDCGRTIGGGDAGHYKFLDTEGSERCTGSMEIFFSTRVAKTSWLVEESVSGYACSSIGESYETILYPI